MQAKEAKDGLPHFWGAQLKRFERYIVRKHWSGEFGKIWDL